MTTEPARSSRRGQPFAPIAGPFRVCEIFRSIQGESSRAGLPTTFVRVAGCSLRCAWCDTAYALAGGSLVSGDAIVAQVAAAGLREVCLTGGEPLEQPETGALAQRLLDGGHSVSIETGGHRDIGVVPVGAAVVMDVKCPGSGMEPANLWPNLELLLPGDEVKLVLVDRADYDWARDVLRSRPLPPGAKVLFSPAYGRLGARELVEWVLRDRLPVRVNLQLHKYVWGPDARGV